MEPGLDPPSKCSNVSSLSSTLSVPRSPSETVLFILFWWFLAAVGILLLLLPKVAVLWTSATSSTTLLFNEDDSEFRCEGDSEETFKFKDWLCKVLNAYLVYFLFYSQFFDRCN